MSDKVRTLVNPRTVKWEVIPYNFTMIAPIAPTPRINFLGIRRFIWSFLGWVLRVR